MIPRINISIANDSDGVEWNEVVLKSKTGSIFSLYEWTKIYSKYLNILYLIAKIDGKAVGIFPIVCEDLLFGKKLVSLSQGIGGICVRDDFINYEKEISKEIINYILYYAKNNRILNIEILSDNTNSIYFENAVVINKWIGYKISTNMHDWNYIWKTVFDKKARNNVNHALKSGATTKIISSEQISDEDIKIFYNMYNSVSDRQNQIPIPLALFMDIKNIFLHRIHICFTLYQDNYSAVRLFLTYPEKKTLYMYMGASYSKYWNIKPNDLGYSETIRWGVENGYENIDLGYSPLPSVKSGHALFKKRWGGEEYNVNLYNINIMPIKLFFNRIIVKIIQIFRKKITAVPLLSE